MTDLPTKTEADEACAVEALVLNPIDLQELKRVQTSLGDGVFLLRNHYNGVPVIESHLAPKGQPLEVYDLERLLQEYPWLETEK